MTSLSASLLPANPSFAGHQTFALRSGWLKKGIDALQSPAACDGSLFARPDALVILGVGKNMVQSIRHWLLATRMAREETADGGRRIIPTRLGVALFGDEEGEGWDPFLEDEATSWLLHWQLAGPGSLAYSWVWTFSFFREYEFARDTLVASIQSGLPGRVSKLPGSETLARDVDCLLHTYIGGDAADEALECPLHCLGLLTPSFEHHYRFVVGEKPGLPPAVFAYALLSYWKVRRGSESSLSAWEIANAEGSPGQVFKLDEDTVLGYLDGIEDVTDGALAFDDANLTRQVVRNADRTVTSMTVLQRCYDA